MICSDMDAIALQNGTLQLSELCSTVYRQYRVLLESKNEEIMFRLSAQSKILQC